MFGVDAWVVFGVLLVGVYAYWAYTDLIRPWLRRNEPYGWAEEADGVEEPSESNQNRRGDE